MITDKLASAVYRLAFSTRKTVIKNLDIIYDGKLGNSTKNKIARKFIKYQIFSALEYLIMLIGGYSFFNIKVEGLSYYKKELKKGNNVSFLSAHYGNWELMGALLARKKIPVYSIILPPRLKIYSFLFDYIRKKYNIGTIIKTDRREIFRKVLDRSSVVTFISDQDGGPTGYYVDFFGKKVSFPSGAASFQAAYDMKFIPVYIKRTGFLKHTVTFLPPLNVSGTTKSEKKQDFVLKTIKFYEKIIKKSPENWLLLYDTWKPRNHYPICEKNKFNV
ncbi:MAG: lysophospholipid acyltransferase family protein [Candidatus Muiribacteriota bacterium]